MLNEENAFDEGYPMGSMESESGEKIALKSVKVTGEVQGVFFASTITQEYKNETDDNLEIIYTFPTGYKTVLLGMDARIGERELVGVVLEKKEAEARYEKAIGAGDSAIMVQEAENGLYTANLGNIAPGERVIVNIRCCQTLRYVNGAVRLVVPTVIDDYYGDQRAQGGLAAHEKVVTDASAVYPFEADLKIFGELARGDISSPTYPVTVIRDGEDTRVTLGKDSIMNRDFVLVMNAPENPSSCLCLEDGDAWIAAASFSPKFPEGASSPVGIKILADCSSSMTGERISQAKKGLSRMLALLGEDDYVSYTRFGSSVRNVIGKLSRFDTKTRDAFAKAIKDTRANMGGTNMNDAMKEVFKIGGTEETPAGVLLITDGDVWDVKDIVESAKRSGHRVFAIGVGEAPQESLLRDLAVQTGGACEFVTNNENMAEAVARMAQRMRSGLARRVAVNWHENTDWTSKPPKGIYDGETVTVFAKLKAYPAEAPELTWEIGGEKYGARCSSVERAASDSLPRVAIRARIDEIDSKKEKLKLALDYQLVTPLTSLFLVYERPEDGKLVDLPKVRDVPQPRVQGRVSASFPTGFHGALDVCSSMEFCAAIPCFLRVGADSGATSIIDSIFKEDASRKVSDAQFDILLQVWTRKIDNMPSLEEVIDAWLAEIGMGALKDELESLRIEAGYDKEQFYALLIEWADRSRGANATSARQARRLLNRAKSGLKMTEDFFFNTQILKWLES